MNRTGMFRLVDLILVLAILGFIGLMIPPAVTYFRTQARQRKCTNNLRKIGGAFYAYHDAHKMFPPAAVQPNWDNLWIFQGPIRHGMPATHENWMILLLPYLDHTKLFQRFDKTVPSSDPKNLVVRMARLPEVCCPDDKYNRESNPFLAKFMDGSETNYARGNYAINMGVSYVANSPGSENWPMPAGYQYGSSGGKTMMWGDGVAGVNRFFSLPDFRNKLGTTVAVDEIRSGLIPEDGRGMWAMGVPGASITYAHGLCGDDTGPNNANPASDDSLGCVQVAEKYGIDGLVKLRMACCNYHFGVIQATARSMHPGGVHILMMDQSVHFVVDGVDPNLWHAIHSRETPERISLANLEVNFEPEFLAPDQLAPLTTSLPDSEKAPAMPEKSLENSLCSKFMLISPGKFIMGLPDQGRGTSEKLPAHEVEISKAFYMAVHEVTQQEYLKIMGKNPSWYSKGGGGAKDLDNLDTSRFPVEQVTWKEATQFCQRLSALPQEVAAHRRYRLPTEAEWEYCCRCASTTPADAARRSKPPTRPLFFLVDQYPANAWGLCGMEDGVWEWCHDAYELGYYSRSPHVDPQGPPKGLMRQPRGSAWTLHALGPHPLDQVEAWRSSRFIGFRLVCEVEELPKPEKK